MTLEQLSAFLAAISAGTMTRAAEDLGIRQSTLSFRIKGLEESLGTRVLERGSGKVGLTVAGERLLPYAQQMMDLADEAERQVHGHAEPQGEVVLAASTVPTDYLLPTRLAAFRKRYPLVTLSVQVKDSRDATRALLDRSCDLAIVGADEGDKRRITSIPFDDDEIVLIAGADGSVADKLSPEQMGEVAWVRRELGSGTRKAVDALLEQAGAVAEPRVEVTSTEAVRRCVLAGMGAAFVSVAAVADDLAAGRLRRIEFPGTPLRRSFFVQRLRTRTLAPQAEALWMFLQSSK